MYGGNYLLAVRKTFFAETVSMNTVMVGMIPAMLILMSRVPGARSPRTPEFWFVMGVAAIAGGITAYPVNWWLVKNGLKHGCMTLPGPDGPAPFLGHRSREPASMAGMAPEQMAQEHHMEMRELPAGVAIAWMVGTFLLMLGAAWLATFAAPISFSRSTPAMQRRSAAETGVDPHQHDDRHQRATRALISVASLNSRSEVPPPRGSRGGSPPACRRSTSRDGGRRVPRAWRPWS